MISAAGEEGGVVDAISVSVSVVAVAVCVFSLSSTHNSHGVLALPTYLPWNIHWNGAKQDVSVALGVHEGHMMGKYIRGCRDAQ